MHLLVPPCRPQGLPCRTVLPSSLGSEVVQYVKTRIQALGKPVDLSLSPIVSGHSDHAETPSAFCVSGKTCCKELPSLVQLSKIQKGHLWAYDKANTPLQTSFCSSHIRIAELLPAEQASKTPALLNLPAVSHGSQPHGLQDWGTPGHWHLEQTPPLWENPSRTGGASPRQPSSSPATP